MCERAPGGVRFTNDLVGRTSSTIRTNHVDEHTTVRQMVGNVLGKVRQLVGPLFALRNRLPHFQVSLEGKALYYWAY